ncbi:hypothetical protein BKA57DRAFT_305552 [Linnemannia elongata]|nr:hypothetical protein BKA57DRAFT_305552 [Linnemannia elongata]
MHDKLLPLVRMIKCGGALFFRFDQPHLRTAPTYLLQVPLFTFPNRKRRSLSLLTLSSFRKLCPCKRPTITLPRLRKERQQHEDIDSDATIDTKCLPLNSLLVPPLPPQFSVHHTTHIINNNLMRPALLILFFVCYLLCTPLLMAYFLSASLNIRILLSSEALLDTPSYIPLGVSPFCPLRNF